MKRSRQGHAEISELIPWYLNGTIGLPQRRQIDAHLAACSRCRASAALEREIYAAMARSPAVQYMPSASLKLLLATMDDADPAAPQPAGEPQRRWRARWGRAAAGALLVAGAALGIGDRWPRSPTDSQPFGYRTVTTSVARAQDEIIRAVFSPTVTLSELQSILAEAQLRIVSGPTEAGVYSLAATSRRPVKASLAILRGHAQVRFAEASRPEADAESPAPH
jgi:hypothetical protein